MLERIMKRKRVCSSESVEENTLIEEIRKKKQKRHLLPNFSLSLQKKKKKKKSLV